MAVPGFKEPKLPAHLRAFDDTVTTRKLIYDGIVESLKKSFPVSDGKHRLELTDLRYSGPQDFSQEAQKKAIMSNRNLNTPLTGTWRVFDEETGGEIDKREDVVLHVPYYTQRGTVINRGNEYSITSQARLKPGIYTRTKQSGEHEAHFNVQPGTGKTFRIWMEPATGIFRVNVGQANIPAYPFLKTLGITDSAMQKAWGPDVYDANVAKRDNQALAKLYQRFSGQKFNPDADQAEQEAYLREGLMTSNVDPQVIARTMGVENASSLSPHLVLRTTQKLLNISRGEEQEDDREAPQFSDYYSVEDFMKERIEKDAGRTARNLLFKIRRDKNLKRVGRGALNPYIQSLMQGSGLAATLDETNPLQILDQQTRVIKLGEGGIGGGVEAVIDEARDVNPGQAGFIDLIAGPESEKVGIDLRTAYRTYKGNDKQLYAEFNDRSGKPVYLNPLDASKATLGFPGQDPKAGMAHVLQEGKAAYVPTKDVDYWIPSSEHMYGAAVNMTPMMTGYMPSRAFYSAKYWSQFLPLVKGEVPLVQSQVPGTDRSFSEYYGRKVAALNSDVNGVVSKITDKGISILDEDGNKHFVETIKNFPYNRMTAISYTPVVKSGDIVRSGDLLASSNFTDATGTLALGVNLKTAVVPARGYSFEDAMVISESAAKKMATERLYGIDKEARRGVEISRKRFISAFPGKFNRAQADTIDDQGVVKPGTVLAKGDPVVLAVGPKLLSTADAQLGKLHKALRNAFRDESVVWEYSSPGEVVDVGRTTTGVKVNIKSASPVQVGDKLTNVEASKGIVAKIIPDDEMPRDGKTGDPYELLLNPMVVLSRVAPNQIPELALAKIAKKTGKPYILPSDPPPEGWVEFARSELAKHGIPDKKEVYDPVTGQMIKPLGEGHMFMSVFHHLAEKKLSGRDVGGYSFEDQPARGGKRGSKRLSMMDTTALLAHGAHEVLKDALLVRGTKNEDYWNALRLGRPLPEPGIPFIYNKLMATLKAGGINVVKKGDIISIMPLTNKDTEGVSSGEIKSSAQINARNFEPVPGGMFDQKLTGGMQGKKWTHVKLTEPMPNPVMEEAIRRLLGLRVADYLAIISGRKELDGLTGGRALERALRKIDIPAKITELTTTAKTARGATRDNAIKSLRYLTGAQKQKINPGDWIIDKVPVIPPVFRPVSMIGDIIRASDLNGLYRDLIETNNSIGTLQADLPPEALADEKAQLYKSLVAAFGLGEAITPEGQSKRWHGAIRQVIGTSPKHGLLQSKVLSKSVDVVARGVAAPDPNLDMDSIGIPADMGWQLYRPFVTRRLVRRGFPPSRAAEMIEKRTAEARDELDREMAVRPVIMDRAPTWHKFNLLAFEPHLVDEDVVRTNPLINSGFNLDYDGDAVNFHVPVTNKAVDEAREKMLPSKNLFRVTDLRSVMHAPSKEMVMGLYQLTRKSDKAKAPMIFATAAQAKKAYQQGLIDVDDPIIIGQA